MRKLLLTSMVTMLATGMPVLLSTAYADTTTTASTAETSTVSPQAEAALNASESVLHGPASDVLRPGANPDDPSEYPYLPPNTQPPTVGPRMEFPQGPAATDSGTTTPTSTTNAAGSPAKSQQQTLPDIAVGKPYTIGTQWPDELFQSEQSNFSDSGQLTDGQFASLSYSDKGWVGLLRQYGRSIVVNLGDVENVRRVSLDFLQNLGAGIEFPDSVTYYASNNGTDWYRIGTTWSAQGGGDYTPQSQSYQLDTNINAQYIRAQFDDKVFAFTDEFSVFGSTVPDVHAAPLTPKGHSLSQIMGDNFLVDPDAPGLPSTPQYHASDVPSAGWGRGTPPGYLTTSDPASAGVDNMQLVYTGSNGSIGTWTENDFLPMVAQEDANGTPKGWLFDATLFGPYSSNLATSSAGWTGWLDDLFSSNIELSALDQAVGTTKQQLHDAKFKEKVVITIPSLTSDPSNFGPIDSSQMNLDLNPADVGQDAAYQNKLKAIGWYIDEVMKRWQSAHFDNLQLVGFYWNPESLTVTDPLDASLIQGTSKLVHRADMKFYWIPYYGAVGVTHWQQLGFDDVMVQPNVSFNWGINAADRLQSVADMGKYYHMGIEMEAHWDVTSTNTSLAQTADNKYFDYFTGGNVFGYEGNVMKSWYLNSKTLVTAYENPDPFYHQVYDNTVQFLNNLWKSTSFQ
ncbi:DUF4855 domain-containing protein [Alicyclobacillus dauci]|uniref:DUF4855 domain-containing protein n=1 Tax=Alicyclobacillus dauci TaxID=1475485 RepID=A0ABY6Z0T3_9BACL|nr:DUF4855 domain-containing protein [Alicyclobacillus dauci]WAH35585.1 DUF4855 domain-containing protein [Alicyclobacillus dauci]